MSCGFSGVVGGRCEIGSGWEILTGVRQSSSRIAVVAGACNHGCGGMAGDDFDEFQPAAPAFDFITADNFMRLVIAAFDKYIWP